MIAPAAKAAVLFFFVTIVQVTIVSEIGILGGSPDLVLVTLVAVALTQGSIFGAVTGFWAGLLIDIARLGTLGFTSLLLTLAGFWIGRYGETTARDRFHALARFDVDQRAAAQHARDRRLRNAGAVGDVDGGGLGLLAHEAPSITQPGRAVKLPLTPRA